MLWFESEPEGETESYDPLFLVGRLEITFEYNVSF